MARSLLLPVLLATIATAAQPVPQGAIAGKVVLTGDVLPGVVVTLTNDRLRYTRTVVTGVDGRYSFDSVTAAAGYRLTASLEGLSRATKRGIEIHADTAQEVTLAMKLVPCTHTFVENEARREPATYVITAEMLGNLPY